MAGREDLARVTLAVTLNAETFCEGEREEIVGGVIIRERERECVVLPASSPE